MIIEGNKIYSDDRRLFTTICDDGIGTDGWVNIRVDETNGLAENSPGCGCHAEYRPGADGYTRFGASAEILAEMAAFSRAADAFRREQDAAKQKAESDATFARIEREREEYQAKHGISMAEAYARRRNADPATTYMGQASMDDEDSIF